MEAFGKAVLAAGSTGHSSSSSSSSSRGGSTSTTTTGSGSGRVPNLFDDSMHYANKHCRYYLDVSEFEFIVETTMLLCAILRCVSIAMRRVWYSDTFLKDCGAVAVASSGLHD